MRLDEREHHQWGVLCDVARERDRQDEVWGPIRDRRYEVSPEMWVTILSEEVGEFAQAVLEGDEGQAYDEAVQVAAVSVSILEAILETMENGEVFV